MKGLLISSSKSAYAKASAFARMPAYQGIPIAVAAGSIPFLLLMAYQEYESNVWSENFIRRFFPVNSESYQRVEFEHRLLTPAEIAGGGRKVFRYNPHLKEDREWQANVSPFMLR